MSCVISISGNIVMRKKANAESSNSGNSANKMPVKPIRNQLSILELFIAIPNISSCLPNLGYSSGHHSALFLPAFPLCPSTALLSPFLMLSRSLWPTREQAGSRETDALPIIIPFLSERIRSFLMLAIRHASFMRAPRLAVSRSERVCELRRAGALSIPPCLSLANDVRHETNRTCNEWPPGAILGALERRRRRHHGDSRNSPHKL